MRPQPSNQSAERFWPLAVVILRPRSSRDRDKNAVKHPAVVSGRKLGDKESIRPMDAVVALYSRKAITSCRKPSSRAWMSRRLWRKLWRACWPRAEGPGQDQLPSPEMDHEASESRWRRLRGRGFSQSDPGAEQASLRSGLARLIQPRTRVVSGRRGSDEWSVHDDLSRDPEGQRRLGSALSALGSEQGSCSCGFIWETRATYDAARSRLKSGRGGPAESRGGWHWPEHDPGLRPPDEGGL